jgi:hypothetical protein
MQENVLGKSERRAADAFFLFRKSPIYDERGADAKLNERTIDFKRIRCPLCRWQPRAESRWYCTDAGAPHYFYHGCGTAWNTFETRGRCPGCGHQWTWTDCLSCGGCSPHEEWYEVETD